MKRSSRGWILLPVTIAIMVALILLVSNFQKEAGLSHASAGGVAAVAAASAARDLASGEGPDRFAAFSDAYLVAMVARDNAPAMNAVDSRLDNVLLEMLDCLTAVREAWQAQVANIWDPATQGLSVYWKAMHPSIQVSGTGTLTAADVRRMALEQITTLLHEAVGLAS